MDTIKNVDVVKIETMAVSNPAAAEREAVVEMSKWKTKCLLLVFLYAHSLHHTIYSMLQCALLMHLLYLPTAYWCISRSYGHPLVPSSLETGG